MFLFAHLTNRKFMMRLMVSKSKQMTSMFCIPFFICLATSIIAVIENFSFELVQFVQRSCHEDFHFLFIILLRSLGLIPWLHNLLSSWKYETLENYLYILPSARTIP